MIEMWVPSISPPNVSLIGSLTTEIYHRIENHWKCTQTRTGIESDILPRSRKTESDTLPI